MKNRTKFEVLEGYLCLSYFKGISKLLWDYRKTTCQVNTKLLRKRYSSQWSNCCRQLFVKGADSFPLEQLSYCGSQNFHLRQARKICCYCTSTLNEEIAGRLLVWDYSSRTWSDVLSCLNFVFWVLDFFFNGILRFVWMYEPPIFHP